MKTITDIRAELERLRYESNRKFLLCTSGSKSAIGHARDRDEYRDLIAALPADETCNGWCNYETDMIAKQVTNDREERWPMRATSIGQRHIVPDPATLILADEMKEAFELRTQGCVGLTCQLALAALGRVDWRAIAKHLLDEAAINPTPAPRDWSKVQPFPDGTRLISIAGENDMDASGDDGQEIPRATGPNAPGEIDRSYRHESGEPYYSTGFEPSGVWVLIDHSELEDAKLYTVLS